MNLPNGLDRSLAMCGFIVPVLHRILLNRSPNVEAVGFPWHFEFGVC